MSERRLILSVGIGDCDVQTFASGGPGGQHQNKTQSGVRIIHRASGARGESRESRSQLQNKRAAFRRMCESERFRKWHRVECARRLGAPTVDELVEDAMRPCNIRVEVKNEQGRWTQEVVNDRP